MLRICLGHSERNLDAYTVQWNKCAGLLSASFLAEISVRSLRKIFIFIIYKYIFRVKVSKKIFHLILKKEALSLLQSWFVHLISFVYHIVGVTNGVAVLAEISLKSPRKLFIFIIKKNIYRIKVSKK